MRRSIAPLAPLFAGAIAAVSFQLAPSTASAGIDSCGNIDISASANCEVVYEGGCVARCEPVALEASCSVELYAKCEGSCSGSVKAECSASCDVDCKAKCAVDPGRYECSAGCEVDCGARCDAYCAANPSKASCKASCSSTCTGECDASCSGTPPSASCEAKCDASCSGSCTADANFSCQVDCQADGYASCEAKLKGGCEAQCKKPDGALFCDGQYIDAGDNLDKCLDYLEGILQIDVTGYARGDAACSGSTCTAEGEAGVECAAGRIGSEPEGPGALMLAAVGAGILVARRRRRE